MSHAVQTHISIFKIISKADKKLQQQIFKIVDKEFVEVVSECCLNFLKGHIKISKTRLKKLKRYESLIRALGDRKQSLKSKKLVVQQKGHLFMREFLSVITDALIKHCKK
jgi:DNA repair exonuclease SbcCD ATPase subunit